MLRKERKVNVQERKARAKEPTTWKKAKQPKRPMATRG